MTLSQCSLIAWIRQIRQQKRFHSPSFPPPVLQTPYLPVSPVWTSHMSPVHHRSNAHRQTSTFKPTSYLSHFLSACVSLDCRRREKTPTQRRVEHETRRLRGDSANRWEAAPHIWHLTRAAPVKSKCNSPQPPHSPVCAEFECQSAACLCRRLFSFRFFVIPTNPFILTVKRDAH